MTLRKVSLLLSLLSVVAMGTLTISCSPRTEEPAETTVPTPSVTSSETSSVTGSQTVSPTDKNVRTEVTRSPIGAVPPGGSAQNSAVPCGYGPAGGFPCY